MPCLRAHSRIAWFCSRSIAVRPLGADPAPPLALLVPALPLRRRPPAVQRGHVGAGHHGQLGHVHQLGGPVAHDLRTPLAGIRAVSEAIADGVVPEDLVAATHAESFTLARRLTGSDEDR